jgi:hypothetical protein
MSRVVTMNVAPMSDRLENDRLVGGYGVHISFTM